MILKCHSIVTSSSLYLKKNINEIEFHLVIILFYKWQPDILSYRMTFHSIYTLKKNRIKCYPIVILFCKWQQNNTLIPFFFFFKYKPDCCWIPYPVYIHQAIRGMKRHQFTQPTKPSNNLLHGRSPLPATGSLGGAILRS